MSKETQYRTSDGYRFRSSAKADAHAQTLKDRTVTPITVGGASPEGGKAAVAKAAAVPAPAENEQSAAAKAAEPEAKAEGEQAQATSEKKEAAPAPKAPARKRTAPKKK